MKVRAPGKLLLSGAYAVLEGAPAIVLAVARYAVADSEKLAPAKGVEARASFGDQPAPVCDTSEMYIGGRKLGIGSSAASLVASLGAKHLAKGDDLAADATRDTIFREARRAHAVAQSGGSGVDVATSTYGGVLRYQLARDGGNEGGRDAGRDGEGAASARGPANVKMSKCALPADLRIEGWFTGESARTSDLLGRVEAFRRRDAAAHRARFDALAAAAIATSEAIEQGSAVAVVDACRRAHEALRALGIAADAPIVPPAVTELARVAVESGGAFFVSGAGGGDVALHVCIADASESSASFAAAATARGFHSLSLVLDQRGVHRAS